MMHRSILPLDRVISITVVGVGGNGSHMAFGLARLHLALKALGHPGLSVTLVDPDEVSESNVVRQLFMPQELGCNKALAMAQRLNVIYGLSFEAVPTTASIAQEFLRNSSIIIGCVDNAKGRAQIRSVYKKTYNTYWLDLGNRNSDGQYILGCNQKTDAWLPSVVDYYPTIVRKSKDDDETPSCSIAESLGRQELFVNQAVTVHALNLLWRLFRYRDLESAGGLVNLVSGRVLPIPIDFQSWRRNNPAMVVPYHARLAHKRASVK